MPNLPATTQNVVAIQSTTTGVVDYLHFNGTTLDQSFAVDYGLGAAWKVVAQGNFNADLTADLVAQNTSTGQLDFLYLGAGAKLIATFITPGSFAPVVGEGFFGNAAGQQGPSLVSQDASGQLNMLAFDGTGKLIASDLIANSVGLAHVVGVATAGNFGGNNPAFAITGNALSAIMTQLPNGQIDVIGLSGSISGGTLTVAATQLLAQSVGLAPVFAVDQDFHQGGQFVNTNPFNPATGLEGVQFVTQSVAGAIGVTYFDSGYGAGSSLGALYASEALISEPGWQVIEGGMVAGQLFPVV